MEEQFKEIEEIYNKYDVNNNFNCILTNTGKWKYEGHLGKWLGYKFSK